MLGESIYTVGLTTPNEGAALVTDQQIIIFFFLILIFKFTLHAPPTSVN